MLDAGGNFAKSPEIQDNERWQVERKARLISESMAQMGVDAMVLGPSDLALGRGFVLEMAEAHRLPYVAVNLERSHGGQVFPGSILKDVGGHRVALIGVVPEGLEESGFVVTDPRAAVSAEIEAVTKRGAELIFLLSSMGQQQTQTLLEATPGVDFAFLSGTGRMTSLPITAGDAQLLEAGRRGKVIGVLSLDINDVKAGWVDDGAADRNAEELRRAEDRLSSLERRITGAKTDREKASLERNRAFYQKRVTELQAESGSGPAEGMNPFSNRFEQLSRDVEDDPGIARLVEAAKVEIEATSKAGAPAESTEDARFGDLMGPALVAARAEAGVKTFGDFVGAQTCRGCHPSQYDQWASTGHAKAWGALVEDHRSQDLQCFGCHVTGHFADEGPKDPASVGYLKNVQCESCHTGGAAHVANPTGVKLPAAVPESTCVTCHTQEMTGGRFDYKTYLPKVVHSAHSAHP